jgi:glucokinase
MKTIALDLGGTRLKLSLVVNGKVVAENILPSLSDNGLIPRLESIENAVATMLQETDTLVSELTGVGISIPGIVDTKRMRVLSINNKFSDIIDFDFNHWSQKNWGIPAYVENDARAALIGEWQYGAGKQCDDLVLMTLGTGIGGAAMIEGKLLHGKHFQAGCLGGHFTINMYGSQCNCGNVGCVESEASTWKLPELFRAHPNFAKSKASKAELLDFETLFTLAEEGDETAKEVMYHCLDAWSAGVVNMIHAYDPEKVIIGGGVMKSGNIILPYIREKVAKHSWTPWGTVQIEGASFTDQAGMLGVAYLLNENKVKNNE